MKINIIPDSLRVKRFSWIGLIAFTFTCVWAAAITVHLRIYEQEKQCYSENGYPTDCQNSDGSVKFK